MDACINPEGTATDRWDAVMLPDANVQYGCTYLLSSQKQSELLFSETI